MVESEEKNVCLKLSIRKMKIMASGPIISCQIGGEKMETMIDFIFLGSKITADGDCKPWNYKMVAPWKKSYDKPKWKLKC